MLEACSCTQASLLSNIPSHRAVLKIKQDRIHKVSKMMPDTEEGSSFYMGLQVLRGSSKGRPVRGQPQLNNSPRPL